MHKIAAELLVERLVDWGVDTVFGLPGDGINGLTEALRRHADRVRFVLVQHEEAAAFMATGYAKTTGRLGVCLATSGPGGIHLLNGLYDAKLDHQPVLALTGMQETALLGTGYQQEVHLERLFADVAGYNAMISVPAQIHTLVDLAVRRALAGRTVSHLTFPNDVQIAGADSQPWPSVAPGREPETAPVYLPAPGLPRAADLQRAADVLNAGHRVVLLAGAGALGARAELLAIAETLAAPIVKTLPGKAAVPDDSPLTTGGIGILGTRASASAMDAADTLFMVGTNFPYTKHLPQPGAVRVVQIDADAGRAGNRIPTEVPLVGDAAETLRALAPLLRTATDRGFLEQAQADTALWRRQMAQRETPEGETIAPEYLAKTLDRVADDDAILTCDSGTIAVWAARHFEMRGGREFYLSANLASMAPALPYAIAAQLSHPGRQCIAFVGDGGFAMLMAEFLTAVREGLPIKVVVNNNGSWGMIRWEQITLGFPEYGVRHERWADFAPWAQACGGLGLRVEKAAELEPALARALAFPGAALVDVRVDPDEPVLPPRVTDEVSESFAQAFREGQPDADRINAALDRERSQQAQS